MDDKPTDKQASKPPTPTRASSSASTRRASSGRRAVFLSSAPTSRQHKPRPVIYKSSNLALTAPDLVAQTQPEAVSTVSAIQKANAVAESVRENYHRTVGPSVKAEAIEGSDDESNAKKYARRLQMNRRSAAASRVRREAYTKALEAEVIKIENDYNIAMRHLEEERAKNTRLTQLIQASVRGDESDIDDLPSISPSSVSRGHPRSSLQPASASAPALVMEHIEDEAVAASPKRPSQSALANALPFPNTSAPEVAVGVNFSAPGNTNAMPQIVAPEVTPSATILTPNLQVPLVSDTAPIDFDSLTDTSVGAVLAAGSIQPRNVGATGANAPIDPLFTGNVGAGPSDMMQLTSPVGQLMETQTVANDQLLAGELHLSPETIDQLGSEFDTSVPQCFLTPDEMVDLGMLGSDLFD